MSSTKKNGGAAGAAKPEDKKAGDKKKDDKDDDPLKEELNEEDQLLKEKLDLLVERLTDRDVAQRVNALDQLKIEISGATKTMTSVPKPLKFLSPSYATIKAAVEAQTDAKLKARCADLTSIIAMVASEKEDDTEALQFCLQGTRNELVSWGHEYLRCLAGQIAKEYDILIQADKSVDQINQLVDQIIPEFINHNEEPEAVDLLLEVERLSALQEFTNANNFQRVCNYLLSCSDYAADTEEMQQTFRTAFDIYRKFKHYPEAMRVAQKMNNTELISELMQECTDPVTLKQLAFMLARQRTAYVSEDSDLQEIISNSKLSEHFKSLARDLDVMEPKHPDAIFKSHLEDRRWQNDSVDSAKKNLALTYVNAFVNAGFGKDLLILAQENNEDWVFKCKDDGQTAAAASLGMLLLWDTDEGIAQIDKYMERRENHIVAGSFMALGLVNSGVTDEVDPVQAILIEKLESCRETELKIGALMGLSFTYAGSARADLLESINPIILDPDNSTQLQTAAFCELIVETCAYSGSGNVLKIQKMLHLCAEHKEEEKESIHQVAAVMGVAMIAFGEEIGVEMALRQMNHLYQYGEPVIKRTIPLAIGLLRISNPEVATMDMLTKLAYDSDENVAMSAIFGLGLIGAGTNNSKLAQNLRLLASYYHGANTSDQLFVVRIAQGLVHMGKGLLGCNPLHSEKFLFSNVSLGGLLTVLIAATDMKTFITGKYHYFLFYLTLSIYPRMLITVNEQLEPIQTQVRVGNAVDTVGQAGKPKRITGFQTHDTPVLIGHAERAELATDEYLPENPVIENFLILRPNPDYEPEQDNNKK